MDKRHLLKSFNSIVEKTVKPLFCITVITLIVVLSISSLVHARVFMQWGAADNSVRFFESLDGDRIYEAEASLNGTAGLIQVFGFRDSFYNITQDIKDSLDISFELITDTMALGLLKSEHSTTRIAVIQPGGEGSTLVINFEQSPDDYKQSLKRPDREAMRGFPCPSGATPLFIFRNNNTKTGMAMANFPFSPRAAVKATEGILTSEGWRQLIPEQKSGGNMMVFVKEMDLCFVIAEKQVRSKSTSLVVLMKEVDTK